MRDRKRVTAGIIWKGEQVLIAQRGPMQMLPNKWEFPGGKVEEAETPQECLQRELLEELDITVSVGKFLGSSCFDYEHIAIELLVFQCEWVSGKLKKQEHQALKWVFPKDLQNIDMAPADIPLIKQIFPEEG